MLEGASPLNPIYIIKARRASDFIIYYFFFILLCGRAMPSPTTSSVRANAVRPYGVVESIQKTEMHKHLRFSHFAIGNSSIFPAYTGAERPRRILPQMRQYYPPAKV